MKGAPMTRRILTLLALLTLPLALASPASAAPPGAAAHLVGSTWLEQAAPGTAIRFHQLNAVETLAENVPASLMTWTDCSHPYECMWTGQDATGTFARYNVDNVYAAPGHCWNLVAPMAEYTKSWWNHHNTRDLNNVNWQNCNYGGGRMYLSPQEYGTCDVSWPVQPGGEPYWWWCNNPASGYPRVSSIFALTI